LTGRQATEPINWREAAAPATASLELVMEQYLFDMSTSMPAESRATVQPNIWLLSAEEMPPILFSTAEVARLLGIGQCRVYDLIRQRELRSVKVGASRRISARALAEYVAQLELRDTA
jgi:excisionase family DNA binding protein